MERDVFGVRRSSGVAVARAERKSPVRAQATQSIGLGHDLLRAVLADHADARIDRRHDLADVTGLRRRQQLHRTGSATGRRLGFGDGVKHAMHAIANLRRPRLVDAFIGQILVIHVSGHHMLPIRLAAPYISMPTDEGESARETGNFGCGPRWRGVERCETGGGRSAKRLRTQHIEEESHNPMLNGSSGMERSCESATSASHENPCNRSAAAHGSGSCCSPSSHAQ